MQIWDIKRGRVMGYRRNSRSLLLCFDPEKSMYLYEPEDSLKQPYTEEFPSMCSVPHDSWRIKDLYDHGSGAELVYMPTWTLPELQAVRNFVADRSPGKMPLSQDDISERFYKVGGIFSHIFGSDSGNIDAIEREQKNAIKNLSPRPFLYDAIDYEGQRGISPYLAQYRVSTEGPDAFRDGHIDLVSDAVYEAVKGRFSSFSTDDKISILRENDSSYNFMRSMCPDFFKFYGSLIANRLFHGVNWQKKSLNDSNFEGFNLKVTNVVRGKSPMVADMKSGVLYELSKDDHPAVGMMYKTQEGLIYGLLVTRPQDHTRSIKIKTTAVDKWLDAIGVTDAKEKVRIAVIPPHPLAEKFKAEYEGDGNGYPQLEVWKLPYDYRPSF